MTTGQIIRQRRKELKVPVEEIAKVLDVSIATVYRYESGDIEKVPGTALEPLSKILQTTPAVLMGWGADNIVSRQAVSVMLTQHESDVIMAYRDKPAIQPAVDKLLDIEPETNVVPFAEPSNIKTVPLSFGKKIAVLGRVPAGTPIEAVEDIVGEIYLDEKYNDGHEYFALKVNGHSMEPEYNDGDYVIVRKQETAENGDDVIAYINGYEATLKRFYKDENGITLQALNPDYETRSFTPDQVNELPISLAGVVTELVRRPQAKKNAARNGRNNKIPPVNAKDIKEQPPFEDK